MMADATQIQTYLASKQEQRLQCLQELLQKSTFFPLCLVQNLFCLPLPESEKLLLVQLLPPHSCAETESLYLEILHTQGQNVGAIAIEQWAKKTSHHKWQEVLSLSKKELPQRIKYKLLEYSDHTSIRETLHYLSLDPTTQELSPAFHGLLFKKSLQAHFFSESIDKIATYYFDFLSQESSSTLYQEVTTKTMPDLLLWWMRFSPDKVRRLSSVQTLPEWIQNSTYNLFLQRELEQELLLQLEESVQKQDAVCTTPYLRTLWPPIWIRHQISPALLQWFLLGCADQVSWNDPASLSCASLFFGIPPDKLERTLSECENPDRYLKALALVQPLLFFPLSQAIETKITSFQGHLSRESRCGLDAKFDRIPKPNTTSATPSTPFLAGMTRFFSHVFHIGESKTISPGPSEPFWDLMVEVAQKPTAERYTKLAPLAAQMPFVMQCCWVHVLHQHPDPAVALRELQQYTSDTEVWFLESVAKSLFDLKTHGAIQEIFSLLEKPSLPYSFKTRILHRLKSMPLSEFQNKIQEIAAQTSNLSTTSLEVREFLENLLFLLKTKPKKNRTKSDPKVFLEIQYKSVETQLQESFAANITTLIATMKLQRKLDLLGYMRPVENKMQLFETYLTTLPLICEIPFLNQQHLRSLMQQICKSSAASFVSLDSLKAYGFFLLCFSRKECPFGLENLFPLRLEGDEDLFTLCRDLHIFQEFHTQCLQNPHQLDAPASREEIWKKIESLLSQIRHAATGV